MSKIIYPPLLLTSCVITSAPFTRLTDTNKRIELTIHSIKEWIRIQPEIKIVICDGSDYDFSHITNKLFPASNIECLYFQNDIDSVILYGKGYGEGEIINYAVKNSQLIKDADFFTKCTAKLWVNNYNNCLNSWNGTFKCDCNCTNIKSINNIEIGYIDTRFYLVSKSFYNKYLATTHLNVNDLNDQPLERCFRDAIIKHNINNFIFPTLPIIKGVAGSTEVNYGYTLKQIIEDKIRRTALKIILPQLF